MTTLMDRAKRKLALSVSRTWERISSPREASPPKARIAINMRPTSSPWGGGNQWAAQMVRSLRAHGYAVRFDLDVPVDGILLIDPRVSDTISFGPLDIERYKKQHPNVFCIHRINENDQRKGTSTMDALLKEANRHADYTVFVSTWLRDYHAARWFDLSRSHDVITNGADPLIFNSNDSAPWTPERPLRLVTHHWSDNRMKGFDVYQEIDQLMDAAKLPEIELWVIGRWPQDIHWKRAKIFGPVHGKKLAALLKQCHVYVTASRWDPGPMHVAEGLQCGLPALYHLDGGGTVEMAQFLGIGFRDNFASAIDTMRNRYGDLRAAVCKNAPSGERMCEHYLAIIGQLIANRRPPS